MALTDQCVQCGLCLPACPTYGLDRIEAESPRGRIALARAWELDTIAPTPAGDTHLDQCLGCRRCEAVCPAGVQYGPLLVQARARQRVRRAPGWRQRGIEWLAARPALLGGLLATYRILYPLLPSAWRPLPRPPALGPFPRLRGKAGMGARRSDKTPSLRTKSGTPTLPRKRGREQQPLVAMFVGCIARPYEAGLRAAVQRLCAAAGVDVEFPRAQTCCGTLHAHAGNVEQADTLAARNRAAFAGSGTVLTLASGCHEAVAEGLRGAAEAVDALDFLARRADSLRFRGAGERIALHLPCTQRSVVRSDAATRALLARVPGLEIVELDAGFGCCGAAGTQMLADPARASAYRQPLLEQFAASGTTRLLSANIGCRLHFANGTRAPVQHPLEFLAGCLE
ncbi:MAG: (Fe-S)-binding protein [Luteimonas sp.]